MPRISVTLLTFQPPIAPLNLEAPKNISLVVVTKLTSQPDKSWLKSEAPLKVFTKDVTVEGSDVGTSIKLLAPRNASFRLVSPKSPNEVTFISFGLVPVTAAALEP